ncbi:SurA N-terminal domain-containing protein [Anaerococcus urinomassiliensis]|uniref:SurA N-terminal domain-containing protein n=1 Tax=Anaerococcus urinomassiliensis TaxID=1745712 RepID=UPI00093B124F|nr:SurA N-terminal domain-containing protein [Anaerococcus urinomassiliensis]
MKQTKIKKTKTTKLLLALLVIISLSSCNNKKEYKNSIAVVGDVPISQELFTKELEYYQKFYSKKYGEDYLDIEITKGKTNNDILQEELTDSLIKDQLMLNDLKANNIKVDDSKAAELRNDLEDQLGGKDSLKANITAIDLSENDFSDVLYRDAIRKQHYDYFINHNKIKDSEILDYYKKNEKYHRMYKYDVLVFDNENEAKRFRENIKSSDDFYQYVKNPIKNYDVIRSDFVYIDDPKIEKANVSKKDELSDVFEFDDKFMILMINSYNENENELLIKLKEIYLKESYEKYLNNLTKKTKIRLFV